MIGIYNGPWSRDNQLACCTIVPTFVARDPKRSAMWKGRKRRDRGTRSILTTCALLIPSAFQTGCDIGRLAFPKYQPANHVTSHTRSILDAILSRCYIQVSVFTVNDRFVGDRPIYRFGTHATRNLRFYSPGQVKSIQGDRSHFPNRTKDDYKSRLFTRRSQVDWPSEIMHSWMNK